jgi:hypothetical protein
MKAVNAKKYLFLKIGGIDFIQRKAGIAGVYLPNVIFPFG